MTLQETAIRAAALGAGLFLWFWSQRVISRKAPTSHGVSDRVHEWTAPLHDWLDRSTRAANGTLIVSSLFVDAFGLYLIFSALFGPTLRPFVALLILFAMRQVCQMICTLPTPPGMIWRNPGFPALLVTYGTSNDFFFSGHTAVSVLGAIEIAHTLPPWAAWVAGAIAAAEGFVVLVLRAHYTMDVFTAVFTAFCAQAVAAQLAPGLDGWLAGVMR